MTNRSDYDRSLVQRDNLSLWFDAVYIEKNWTPKPSEKRGAQFKYSDKTLNAKSVIFHLPYRTLEGFARSLMRLIGLSREIRTTTPCCRFNRPENLW